MTSAAARDRRALTGLFTADGISTLGTRMTALAVPWFVLASTGSGTLAGVAVVAELLPYVVVQALGGPVVDRVGAWRTRVGADLVAGLVVLTVPLLYAAGALPFLALLAALAVTGVLRGCGDTAGFVLVPGAAERSGTPLERAAGVHDGVRRTASLVGAPLAGVLIAVTSAPVVLAVDAATFVVAALVVAWRVPRTVQPPAVVRDDAAESYLTALREGFRFLRGDRLLLGVATMVAVTNLLDQAWSAVLTPTWATEVARSPVALGLVFAAVSGGSVIGNVVAAWLGPRLPRRWTFAVGFVVGGAPRFAVLALATSVPPVFAVTLLSGLGAGVLNPILGAVEYERVPRALQARVLGATNAVAWVGMPVGGLAAGLGVDHLGLVATLWVAGATYLLTTAAPFVFPAWRGMDRAPAGVASTPGAAAGVAAGPSSSAEVGSRPTG